MEAVVMLAGTQAALKCFHFQTVRRVLMRYSRGTEKLFRPVGPEKIAGAIASAKRELGYDSTCLAEAITAEAIFRQHGHASELCLGARNLEGKFEAHAWLEKDACVLVGGPVELTSQYNRFPKIECAE